MQGTKGMFMRAAVELNTDEERVKEEQRERERKARLQAAGIIPPLPPLEHKEGRALVRPL